MMSFDDLLSAASHLSPLERLQLSDMLRDTVDPTDWPALSEDWLGEVDRRSQAFDIGQMPAAPWPEVRQRARKQAGLDG